MVTLEFTHGLPQEYVMFWQGSGMWTSLPV